LTLLVAAAHERNGTFVEEPDELTNHDNRSTALLQMAETKPRGAIHSISRLRLMTMAHATRSTHSRAEVAERSRSAVKE
jgi:hypothetical protein